MHTEYQLVPPTFPENKEKRERVAWEKREISEAKKKFAVLVSFFLVMARDICIMVPGRPRPLFVQAENFETVRHLKAKVASELGVAADSLLFLIGNQNDDTKLGEIDMSKETILRMVFKGNRRNPGNASNETATLNYEIPRLPAALGDTKDSHNYRVFCKQTKGKHDVCDHTRRTIL